MTQTIMLYWVVDIFLTSFSAKTNNLLYVQHKLLLLHSGRMLGLLWQSWSLGGRNGWRMEKPELVLGQKWSFRNASCFVRVTLTTYTDFVKKKTTITAKEK